LFLSPAKPNRVVGSDRRNVAVGMMNAARREGGGDRARAL